MLFSLRVTAGVTADRNPTMLKPRHRQPNSTTNRRRSFLALLACKSSTAFGGAASSVNAAKIYSTLVRACQSSWDYPCAHRYEANKLYSAQEVDGSSEFDWACK